MRRFLADTLLAIGLAGAARAGSPPEVHGVVPLGDSAPDRGAFGFNLATAHIWTEMARPWGRETPAGIIHPRRPLGMVAFIAAWRERARG